MTLVSGHRVALVSGHRVALVSGHRVALMSGCVCLNGFPFIFRHLHKPWSRGR